MNGPILAVLISLFTAVPSPGDPPITDPVPFREVWGYLMKGEEDKVRGTEPFTDICYFNAGINGKGELIGVAPPPSIKMEGNRRVRYHLVICELSNYSLTHFVLNPKLPVRRRLIADIARAAGGFDGVQIDFESVYPADARNFHRFLRDLKRRLPKKVLSVAVPPRRQRSADAYDYRAVSRVADRVVVMAYDQHWSTSRPGPVASKEWAEEVARNAMAHIPKAKLIMGLPLYGRAWQERRLDRALRYSQVEELMESRKIVPREDGENGLVFEYDENIRVIAYFESVSSILAKLRLYSSLGIDSVSFWRIGQENGELWTRITAH